MTKKVALRKNLARHLLVFGVSLLLVLVGVCSLTSYAAGPGVTIDFQTDPTADGALGAIDLIILFAVIALIPSILLMMTSFTRIIIVLSFMRNALGTQQAPPNQVLLGLALCLTLFTMSGVITQVQTTAYDPYKEGEITQKQALDAAAIPIKQFMIKQTSLKSINLYLKIADTQATPVNDQTATTELQKLSLPILIPAFVTSELERAFWIGFLLYLPFLIIDMVVSSVLMSMGMVMLPPAMISLPFKILMFVLVDGWGLLMGTLAQGFL